jgi:hypothetical protein
MNTRAHLLTLISAGLITLVGLSAPAESKGYLKGDGPPKRGYSQSGLSCKPHYSAAFGDHRQRWTTAVNRWRATLTAKYGSFSRSVKELDRKVEARFSRKAHGAIS